MQPCLISRVNNDSQTIIIRKYLPRKRIVGESCVWIKWSRVPGRPCYVVHRQWPTARTPMHHCDLPQSHKPTFAFYNQPSGPDNGPYAPVRLPNCDATHNARPRMHHPRPCAPSAQLASPQLPYRPAVMNGPLSPRLLPLSITVRQQSRFGEAPLRNGTHLRRRRQQNAAFLVHRPRKRPIFPSLRCTKPKATINRHTSSEST